MKFASSEMTNAHQNACAVLLAGGQGKRIRALYPNVPKPFIRCADRPFIEWVLHYFRQQGLRRFVVSLGHLADVADAALPSRIDEGTQVTAVREPYPLGTGGAFLHVRAYLLPCDVVVCANADSLVLADLEPVWTALEDPLYDGAVLGVKVHDASRYGLLEIEPDGTLASLREKKPGRGVINAGVYFFKADILGDFPIGQPLSMETDVFPHLLSLGMRFFVHAADAPFLDIGTPESIRQADRFIQAHLATRATP